MEGRRLVKREQGVPPPLAYSSTLNERVGMNPHIPLPGGIPKIAPIIAPKRKGGIFTRAYCKV